jgi:hypothetical protein
MKEAMLTLLVALVQSTALAQHQHPKEDAELHEKFYSTWYMPDKPDKSCCNNLDCYPTQARHEDGNLFARRREDGKWLKIPPAKIEQNRDNPDGRSHMCAAPPSVKPDTVFCFTLGAGI